MINHDHKQLLEQAHKAMLNAYAPYSKFNVGAALLTKDGTVYLGCNVENCSYGASLCAERIAIAKAAAEGEREFQAIAVVSSSGDFTMPCGMCRQVMAEFGLDLEVVVTNGYEIKVYPLRELLAHAFTPVCLKE